MRLFVGLSIPDVIADALQWLQGGVPGARWQRREQLHLTLRFIGEADGAGTGAIIDALAGIDAPGFDLTLHGVGQFGNNKVNSIWAGARPNPALDHLQRKVDGAIRRAGQPQDAYKFMPHVTLARMRHPGMERLRDWLSHNGLYTSAPFAVRDFHLYSSHQTDQGSLYRVEQDFPLRTYYDQADD